VISLDLGANHVARHARFKKSLDAASAWANVTLLRRHQDTDADESISGRSFWEARYGKHAGHWSWVWTERIIDALFWWDRRDGMKHCELADLRDYKRAKEKVRRFEGRRNGAFLDD